MSVSQSAVAGILAFVLTVGGNTAWAASGTALGVDPQAQADKDGAARVLAVGADIFIGDMVRTGPHGNVQIKFDDDTELVVGPNSALLIEDYLLRDDQSVGKFAVNALSGTFRFATGHSAKDRYLITTPTGTIGVRGTWFDFNVGEETRVLVYRGEVILCDNEGQCVTLSDSCEIGTIDINEAAILGNADDTEGDLRDDLKAAFIYAQNQSPLNREFWFENARECFNKSFETNFPNRKSRDNSRPEPEEPEEPNCDFAALDMRRLPMPGIAFPVSDATPTIYMAAVPACPE